MREAIPICLAIIVDIVLLYLFIFYVPWEIKIGTILLAIILFLGMYTGTD